MAEILRMQNINKSYYLGGKELEVLHDINLTIHAGEFVSLLGPSGSGKTTMMNIIGCLDTATSGNYILSGNDIDSLDEVELAKVRNKEIGFVFQSFQLLARLTALSERGTPPDLCRCFRIREKKARERRSLHACRIRGRRRKIIPINYPAASSSGSPSPEPWSLNRPFSWPMSRPERLTRRPGRRSWNFSKRSIAKDGPSS